MRTQAAVILIVITFPLFIGLAWWLANYAADWLEKK